MPAGLVRECDGVATTAVANFAGRRHNESLLDPRKVLDVLRRELKGGWALLTQETHQDEPQRCGKTRRTVKRRSSQANQLECPGVSVLQ